MYPSICCGCSQTDGLPHTLMTCGHHVCKKCLSTLGEMCPSCGYLSHPVINSNINKKCDNKKIIGVLAFFSFLIFLGSLIIPLLYYFDYTNQHDVVTDTCQVNNCNQTYYFNHTDIMLQFSINNQSSIEYYQNNNYFNKCNFLSSLDCYYQESFQCFGLKNITCYYDIFNLSTLTLNQSFLNYYQEMINQYITILVCSVFLVGVLGNFVLMLIIYGIYLECLDYCK